MRSILIPRLAAVSSLAARSSLAVSRAVNCPSSSSSSSQQKLSIIAQRSAPSPSTTFFSTAAAAAAAMASSTSGIAPLPCDKIICLGKNYVEHQKEMGGPAISMPVIFLKPPSCVVYAKKEEKEEGGGRKGDDNADDDGLLPVAVVEVPRGRGSCHYETELVLRVGPDARSFDAVTIGLDLTLRDVQNECKKTGHPWETAKVFRGAAVLGDWVPLPASAPASSYLDLPFEFDLADTPKIQTGVGSEMMVFPEEALKFVDSLLEVVPGDLFFTGTPAGVGPVLPGQEAEVRLLEKGGEDGGSGKALVRYRVRFE